MHCMLEIERMGESYIYSYTKIFTFKLAPSAFKNARGTCVAQLFKHLTLIFIWGRDLRSPETELHIGLWTELRASLGLSLPLLALSFSFSLKK